MKPQDIDIVSYLRSRGIRYWEEGKNISQDWIGIQCLWCDDKTNHLGIHTTKGTINCFRCPTSGTVLKLIMKIERCGFSTAQTIASNFNRFRSTHSYPLVEQRSSKSERLRRTRIDSDVLAQFNFDENALPIHEKFLKDRYFDPIHLIEKYKIKFCGPLSEFALRIIIPVYVNNVALTFTARDATNRADPPYRNCPNDKALINIKDTLYNLDNSARPDVIIVEGVTDVWRIGNDCVATFGVQYTPEQVLKLSKFRRCFVLFDAEDSAQEQAQKLCQDLSTIVHDVVRLELDKGDPADMKESDVKLLRKQIFGQIY